jgi:hypothetical protein
MKYITILLITLTVNLFAQRIETVKEDLWFLEHKMTRHQLHTAIKIYRMGRPYNLQYTCVAIAWQESHLGEWKLNLSDPSAGVFHELLPQLAVRLGKKPNNWNNSRLAENLMHLDYAFKTFIITFSIKQQMCYNNGYTSAESNWRCAVMAYNSYNNETYYRNIVNKIKAFKIYVKTYHINLQ